MHIYLEGTTDLIYLIFIIAEAASSVPPSVNKVLNVASGSSFGCILLSRALITFAITSGEASGKGSSADIGGFITD